MRKSLFRMLILVFVIIVGAANAKAQTRVTLDVPKSGTTFASNRPTAVPSSATQSDTYEFTRGPVITAPEPSSMLLFGSGLLVVAIVLRWRLRASKTK